MNRWLLQSGIQVHQNDVGIGIAGWLDNNNNPEFIYPEITGYYLTYLAFEMARSTELKLVARDKALAVIDWLYNSGLVSPPATRIYLNKSKISDWRNKLVYSFDIGMILRGLYAIQKHISSRKLSNSIKIYRKYLLDFQSLSFPLIPIKKKFECKIPQRWSTKLGPHQAKIASMLIFLNPEIDSRLFNILKSIYEYWDGYLVHEGDIQSFHSLLYYLEGIILIGLFTDDHSTLLRASENFQIIINSQTQDGFLPTDSFTRDNLYRADVQAQALRIGAILQQYEYLDDATYRPKLDQLRRVLMEFIGSSGAVNFYPISDINQGNWNTWCTMFAYQALYYYDKVISNTTIRGDLIELLI